MADLATMIATRAKHTAEVAWCQRVIRCGDAPSRDRATLRCAEISQQIKLLDTQIETTKRLRRARLLTLGKRAAVVLAVGLLIALIETLKHK